MAVFRVEKNSGYTVMSNHHLRNRNLSLKAKGLLSQMPVSYTHLDVYKRQDEYTGPKAGEQGGHFPSVEPIVAQNLPFSSFFLNVNTCKLFTMCS